MPKNQVVGGFSKNEREHRSLPLKAVENSAFKKNCTIMLEIHLRHFTRHSIFFLLKSLPHEVRVFIFFSNCTSHDILSFKIFPICAELTKQLFKQIRKANLSIRPWNSHQMEGSGIRTAVYKIKFLKCCKI